MGHGSLTKQKYNFCHSKKKHRGFSLKALTCSKSLCSDVDIHPVLNLTLYFKIAFVSSLMDWNSSDNASTMTSQREILITTVGSIYKTKDGIMIKI